MSVFSKGLGRSFGDMVKSFDGNISGTDFGKLVSDVSNTIAGAWDDITERGISGIWDDYTGNTANQQNIEYQKEYNEQVFKRADTQYQRTVADLRAAGLSSQLAAGAPSTVAGQSSSPERTVGNESAAIEKLIGMVTSMKQTEASVNLTNAQADKAKAETAMVNKEIGTYGERHALDMILKRSEASYNIQLTKIAQIEGQSKAALIDSQINSYISSSKYNDQLRSLAQKQASLVEAQTLGQYESNIATREGVKKTKAEIQNLDLTYYKIKNDIVESMARQDNLDASTKKILDEAANVRLSTEVLRYNLMMSEGLGLRTNENIPSSLWSSASWAGKTVEDILWGRRDSNLKRFEREVLNWSWKWTPLRWIIEKDFPFKFGK